MNRPADRAVVTVMGTRHLPSTATVLAGVMAITACDGISAEPSAVSVAAEPGAVASADPYAAKAARAPFEGVPVLVFHGICPTTCEPSQVYSIPSAAFEELLTALSARGYQTLSAHDYAQFLLGRANNLPPRPILITFDDGRTDGYLGADPILARLHMKGFPLSIDDFVITFFTSGPGSTTLPLKIYSMVRFSVTPEMNAAATVLIALTVALVLAGIAIQSRLDSVFNCDRAGVAKMTPR